MDYTYKAKVISVYDGDTIRADIDLGFGVWLRNQSIRLEGINAPEVRGEEKESGIVARDRLIDLLNSSSNECVLKSHMYDDRGKFGRIIADIWTDLEPYSLNETLVKEGLAERYE